ncbi:hypothetical protein ACJIZ3_010112 [Penstemon smallii]|uniref:KNOX2 domain-containing protein n=1 Tax=Penstemon smallii TaxID=265156 RepID=A0ABD3TFJ0_9LAMI
MERKRKGEKIHHDHDHDHFDHGEESSDHNVDILKKEIACHTLYRPLIQSHLECLKLCLDNNKNDLQFEPIKLGNQPNLLKPGRPELDYFMEAYCMTLNKLKEAMEEPQQESMAFINYMYSQLNELAVEIPSSTTSSVTNSSSKIDD